MAQALRFESNRITKIFCLAVTAPENLLACSPPLIISKSPGKRSRLSMTNPQKRCGEKALELLTEQPLPET